MLGFAIVFAFLVGITLGWAAGLRFGRVSEAARVAAASQDAQVATTRAQAAEKRITEFEGQLHQARAELTSAEVQNGRLQTTADRLPSLEQTISELRTQLSTTQGERAGLIARVDQISPLEASLGLAQQQLLEVTQARANLQAKAALIPQLETAVTEERRRVEALQTVLTGAEQEKVRLVTQLEEASTRAQEQLQLLANVQTAFRDAFRALSAEALKSNNQAFLDLAKTTMGEFHRGASDELEHRQKAIEHLLGPVHESLSKFHVAVEELEKNRLTAYTALTTQVGALQTGQRDLHSETGKLVKALRAPVTRGRWGEIQLRNVVEMAGMVEHCDFVEQASVPTEDGLLRPDVIVKLPGTKTTVIDSKVPLTAYLDSLEADGDADRRKLLRDHATQLRNHISQLASKAYWDQLPSNPDFVIMYVPLESAFAAALQEDPNLIDFAVASSVIPTDR
jgi:DNA recombination protein RmuC